MSLPVVCSSHQKNLILKHNFQANPFRNNFSFVLGILKGVIFIFESIEGVEKVYQFSLLTGEHLKTHTSPDGKRLGVNWRSYKITNQFKICANLKDPDNPLLFWTAVGNNYIGSLYRSDLSSWETIKVYDAVDCIVPLVIDHEKRLIYFKDLSSHETYISSIEIDVEKFNLQKVLELSRILSLDFDSDQDLLFISDEYEKYFSFDPSTRTMIQINSETLINWCCCQNGILSFLDTGDFGIITLKFFNHQGQFFSCDIEINNINTVLFDWTTKSIILTSLSETMIILPDQFIFTSPNWSVQNHHQQPLKRKKRVEIFTMIRSLQYNHVISLLPNELLFEIFKYL